ncbi:MAG: ferrous iron transporter B [Defluviitaleaceae bacterium]|nr:ferrous iron transporter B [Defluviitaleaceae bacterium]
MSCHNVQVDDKALNKPNKILLMGNPNVGKSVFFSELTGINVISSNFSGTTVNFTEGRFEVGFNEYTLIDVPGVYSLTPTSEAEAVAARFVESGALAVICVLDASNLERNLRLAMELTRHDIPTVYALNMMDVAKRHGVDIDVKKLEEELGAPVVETIAVKRQGFDKLIFHLEALLMQAEMEKFVACRKCEGCPWAAARDICNRSCNFNGDGCENTRGRRSSFLDKLGDKMVKPFPGLPIASLVMVLLVGVVVFGGRLLRMPLIMLVDGLIVPFFRNVFEGIFGFFAGYDSVFTYRYLFYDGGFQTGFRVFVDGSFHSVGYDVYSAIANNMPSVFLNVLIGEYGIFIISFQWIIALILPYVFAFYLAITFLEDSGYLPRVSVLFDNIMRKLGVQGGSLIHMFLALGCAIPAILGSRAATTKKERRMIAVIVCFAVPCISQIGALAALMGEFSWWMPIVMVLFALLMFVLVAFVAGKVIKGKTDPLILEIPNLLLPNAKTYFRKLAIRMKHFLKDAEVPMLIAVFIAALLAGTGILNIVASNPQVQAVVSGWLGLPEEAVVSLILGIVRREMSVAPLILLNLTYLQAFVAGAVSLLYLPCLSVFGILAKEFKIRFAIAIFVGTIVTAILVGGIINQIGQLFL